MKKAMSVKRTVNMAYAAVASDDAFILQDWGGRRSMYIDCECACTGRLDAPRWDFEADINTPLQIRDLILKHNSKFRIIGD